MSRIPVLAPTAVGLALLAGCADEEGVMAPVDLTGSTVHESQLVNDGRRLFDHEGRTSTTVPYDRFGHSSAMAVASSRLSSVSSK